MTHRPPVKTAAELAQECALNIIFGMERDKRIRPDTIPAEAPFMVTFEGVWKPINALLLATGRVTALDAAEDVPPN